MSTFRIITVCIPFFLFQLGFNAFSQSSKYTEVPMVISQTGQLLIEATINNHSSPTHFFIETQGFNRLRADQPEMLGKYGLEAGVSKHKVNSIQIGDMMFENSVFYARDQINKRGNLTFPPPVIGTLGPKFFKNLVIQFDFKVHEFRIAQNINDLPVSDEAYEITYRSSFTDRGMSLNIETSLLPQRTMAIDTRSPLGIHIHNSEIPSNVWKQIEDLKEGYYFSLDGETSLFFSAINFPEIYVENDLTLKNQKVWVSSFLGNSIGVNFLKNYIFTIDTKEHKLYFDPINKEGRDAIEK